MFMILNSREFLLVLYVAFLTISSFVSFLPLCFVIIDWIILLSEFYILLFTIRLAFGILFKTSFTFASKMVYFAKSLVSIICFFFFNFLLFFDKVSVFLPNFLCLEFPFPLLDFIKSS